MMTHRKPEIRHQKPAASKVGDQFTGCSEGRVSGVRCKVGVISFQAPLRNCGNQSSDCQGRNASHQSDKRESTNVWHWGGTARISVEILVMSMERRGSVKRYLSGIQLRKQEEIS